MTKNFKARKGGAKSRPQLSPDEWREKKQAEKDAVYQMIDSTAAEIVTDGAKFKAFLDTQARMDRYSASNALLIYKQFPRQHRSRSLGTGRRKRYQSRKAKRAFLFLNPLSMQRATARQVSPTMSRRFLMFPKPTGNRRQRLPPTVTRRHSLP